MMKLRTLLPLSLLFLFIAGAVADDSVVAISVDEIHADASTLEGQRYISTGQPSEETLSLAREAGFVAVIDMRTESEDRGFNEAAAVSALGMEYIQLPVAGAQGTTFENAAALDDILAGIDGPVLMHCASGNRVGALIALRESANGASADDAIAAGKAAGLTRLEARVTELLTEQ